MNCRKNRFHRRENPYTRRPRVNVRNVPFARCVCVCSYDVESIANGSLHKTASQTDGRGGRKDEVRIYSYCGRVWNIFVLQIDVEPNSRTSERNDEEKKKHFEWCVSNCWVSLSLASRQFVLFTVSLPLHPPPIPLAARMFFVSIEWHQTTCNIWWA